MAQMEQDSNFKEYEKEFTVTADLMDRNNHLNNVSLVKWIEEISIEHSDAVGGTKKMESLACAWMIHTQHVEYKAQAFLGEKIKGITWVPEYSKISTNRYCKFVRLSDNKEIARSVTTWVLMDIKKERPTIIPEELKQLFRK